MSPLNGCYGYYRTVTCICHLSCEDYTKSLRLADTRVGQDNGGRYRATRHARLSMRPIRLTAALLEPRVDLLPRQCDGTELEHGALAQSARQKVELARARVEVGRLAAETYRRGEMTTLDVLLGDDPDAVLAQAGYLPSLSERQSGATNRLKQGEQELATTQLVIAQQQQRAQQANAKMKAASKLVKQKLARAQAQLASLQASQRVVLRHSQEAVQSAGVPKGAGSAFCLSMAAKAGNSGARASLRFACDQLGKPYQWAADGPGSYDCSGLTMKSWQAGGVSLPHSSAQQAGYGTHVSNSSLQPGDLVTADH